MMRAPAEMTSDELREAIAAADTLLSEKFRPCLHLSGRLLPVLVARFSDEVTEATGGELPPLPRRQPGRPVKLDELTSSELDTLSGAVLTLVTRFAALMGDPALPQLLRDLRDSLVIEKADRARIAGDLREKARTSKPGRHEQGSRD
jgi:hypothetical protein